MYKRYIDNTKENRVDFVSRNYGISAFKIVFLLSIAPIFISILYLLDIYDKNINIIINNVFIFTVIFFISIKIKNYLKIISTVEYQNTIFANALNHNTEFCLILDNGGKVIYADARFNERLQIRKNNYDLFSILRLGNVSDHEIENFQCALKNKSSIQTYFFLSKENNIANFTVTLDPMVMNPEIAIDCTELLELTFNSLARPQNYFVLKAVKVSKEQMYEKLLERHVAGMYVTNASGEIISANDSFLKMFELKHLKKGQLFTDLLAKRSLNLLKKGEGTFLTTSGVTVSANVTNAIFYDKYNRSYVYGLITPKNCDIIDYHLHPCFMEAPIAIAQCDKNGLVIRHNKALQKFYDNKEFSYLFDLIASSYHKKIKDYFNNNSINNLLLDAQLYNDASVKLYFNKFIYKKSILIICYIIDAADSKDLELKLERSQKMQAIGQLAGGIAHDFNNILTAISGFCDLLLLRHKTGDPSFADIMQIKQNSNRASNLIKQLLAFSRKQTLKPKILDVNNIIANLFYMIKRLIGENIEFKVNYSSNIGLVKADRGQLEQVIINLIVNSRAAMQNGGKLTIKTYDVKVDSLKPFSSNMFSPDKEVIEHGKYVVIEVIDTGHGISSEVMKKMFEPFFSTKDAKTGTGLGLSTVYGIVKQTGGYIYVDSKVNVGTTFKILLPRAYILHDEKIEGDIEHLESPIIENNIVTQNKKITILLIEDEDPVRMFSTKALVKKGYNVIDINSPKKALEIIKNSKVDIVITDVVMPGMSGPDIVAELVKINPDLKVIFISGYAEEVFTKNHDIDISNINFLPKPFSFNQLVTKVQEIIAAGVC